MIVKVEPKLLPAVRTVLVPTIKFWLSSGEWPVAQNRPNLTSCKLETRKSAFLKRQLRSVL